MSHLDGLHDFTTKKDFSSLALVLAEVRLGAVLEKRIDAGDDGEDMGLLLIEQFDHSQIWFARVGGADKARQGNK